MAVKFGGEKRLEADAQGYGSKALAKAEDFLKQEVHVMEDRNLLDVLIALNAIDADVLYKPFLEKLKTHHMSTEAQFQEILILRAGFVEGQEGGLEPELVIEQGVEGLEGLPFFPRKYEVFISINFCVL